jgi:hypothetical protein
VCCGLTGAVPSITRQLGSQETHDTIRGVACALRRVCISACCAFDSYSLQVESGGGMLPTISGDGAAASADFQRRPFGGVRDDGG